MVLVAVYHGMRARVVANQMHHFTMWGRGQNDLVRGMVCCGRMAHNMANMHNRRGSSQGGKG